jgi:hypothetical protein
MDEALGFEDRLALRGKLPGVTGRGPRRAKAGRVCADERCQTVLSVYNPQDRCWEHTQPTPYLLNVRRFRHTKMPA